MFSEGVGAIILPDEGGGVKWHGRNVSDAVGQRYVMSLMIVERISNWPASLNRDSIKSKDERLIIDPCNGLAELTVEG